MLELWTSPTPNGWKVSIMIEELIEAGIDLGEIDVRMIDLLKGCLLYTSPSPRDLSTSRMPSSA